MASILMKLPWQLKFDITIMKIEPTIDTILHDRYQLQNLFSQKQGRTTFLALDLQSQNLVIIKLIRLNLEFQWDDLKLFEREAATLQNLDHPAIPKYLDYFDLPDGFALVQTYIEAPSLQTLIQTDRKFTEAEVMELADRLLDILTYLHTLHPPVIHRDLKPSNILLTNRSGNSIGDVYLVDFGSVQTAASQDSSTITIVGSYGYTSPEQFYGQTITGSDLYSLGMTLIYLLTGTHPAKLLTINGRVKFDRTNLSNKFAHWLEKMTEYDLNRRFSSATIAKQNLPSKHSDRQTISIQSADRSIFIDRRPTRLDIQLPGVLRNAGFWSQSNMLGFLGACYFLSGIVIFVSMLIFLLMPGIISSNILSAGIVANTIVFFIMASMEKQRSFSPEKYIESPVIAINLIDKYMEIGIYSTAANQIRWDRNRSNRPIDAIIYHPRFESSSHPTFVTTEAKLSIHMGKYEYIIPSKGISELELCWLGEELSDALNLDLQFIAPSIDLPSVYLDSGDPPNSEYGGCANCCCF
jgi:serine/threonine protein kinase